MHKYQIELSDEVNRLLEEEARMREISIEAFIGEILNRYAVDPHIMDKEDVARGYEEMGEINLQLSK